MFRGKNAVIFGGSGAIGSTVAQVLAREGARVFIGARTQGRLDDVADKIAAAGGMVETFLVDVHDETATMAKTEEIVARSGGIDVAMNATGFLHVQGMEIFDLSLAEFMLPIHAFLSAQFVTAKAVAPHMGTSRPGVIIILTAPAGRMAIPGHLGHIVTSAGEEAFSRVLASELGPRNIRVVCLRTHALADAIQAGSYTGQLFAPKSQAMGLTVDQWLGGAAQGTMLGRLPTLSQVAETVAFLASDHANAMTATVVNMTAGMAVD